MKKRSISSRFGLALSGALVPAALLATACLSRVTAQESPTEPAGKSKQFKNIKVLKDLPAKELIPTMHRWNTSLGVRCDYCHVRENFAADTKPTKNIARTMVTMMADINKHQKAIRNQATCYLCHHGKPEPETHGNEGDPIPPIPGEPKR